MAAVLDDVVSLVIFAKVVEAKSFTAAARKLGFSKSVASARVAQLEQRLATKLLHRTTRRLSLTTDGLALYERAARIAAEADAATSLSRSVSHEPRGVLRVSAPITFAQLYLTEPIARYLATYAGVKVELLLSDGFVDLVEEGIDVALRISARLRDSSLVGRKLAEDRTVVCASPAYLERRGVPVTPADLVHHDCLRYSLLKAADEWVFRGEGRSYSVPVEARFQAGSGTLLREAALAGIGIAVLPSFVVAEDLARGRLQAVLGEYTFVRIALYALYGGARVLPVAVRSFVSMLAEHFEVPPWARADVASSRPRVTGKKGLDARKRSK